MVKCLQCGKEFETATSLASHRAWHTGKLKNWQKVAALRTIDTKTTWKKHGKELVQSFLLSILDPEHAHEITLIDEIWNAINGRLQ